MGTDALEVSSAKLGAAIGVSFITLAGLEACELETFDLEAPDGVLAGTLAVLALDAGLTDLRLFEVCSEDAGSLGGEGCSFCSSPGCFRFSFEFATCASDILEGLDMVGNEDVGASAISSSESLSDSLSESDDSEESCAVGLATFFVRVAIGLGFAI